MFFLSVWQKWSGLPDSAIGLSSAAIPLPDSFACINTTQERLGPARRLRTQGLEKGAAPPAAQLQGLLLGLNADAERQESKETWNKKKK